MIIRASNNWYTVTDGQQINRQVNLKILIIIF